MTRRDTFDALGGFDESQSIVNNDLDFALRARQRGLLTIYTPHARLVHHEAVSRAALDDDYDKAAFDSRWRDLFLAGDPYFSPHLSKHHDDFTVDDEPTQLLVTGRPLVQRDAIKKILVVKLDHIGDCVIAFPAIRRLRRLFPAAHIAVLTSRASRPVWSLEPSVDETIEFDFFHARSGLGEIERSDEDWRELRTRLTPEAFDLAVDLRKHTETRPVLQHTGARLLAGFDFRNQFPWLDIALEWTGDQVYARKRQHNADDLVNLVDAIGAASEGDRRVIAAPATAVRPPAAAKRLSAAATGPLVCVHPTVGNDARQWPVEYFAAVIDRLIEDDAARVVLIGAPGRRGGRCRHPGAGAPAAGRQLAGRQIAARRVAGAARRRRLVSRQQQRPKAHRGGSRRADGRHPFRHRGRARMGPGRPRRDRRRPRHGVRPVLPRLRRRLPPRPRLPARTRTGPRLRCLQAPIAAERQGGGGQTFGLSAAARRAVALPRGNGCG